MLRHLKENLDKTLIDIEREYSKYLTILSIIQILLHLADNNNIENIIRRIIRILSNIFINSKIKISNEGIELSCNTNIEIVLQHEDILASYIEFLNNIAPISKNSDVRINKISISSIENYVKKAIDNIFPIEIDLATPYRLDYNLVDLFRKICNIKSNRDINKLYSTITRIIKNTTFKIIIENQHETTFRLSTENISIELSEEYSQYLNTMLTYLENNIENIKNNHTISLRLGIITLPIDSFRSILSILLSEEIIEKFLSNIAEMLREGSCFNNIIFIPYGRELLVSMVKWSCPLTELESLEDVLNSLLSPIHLSYLMHVTNGIRTLQDINNGEPENKSLSNVLNMLELLINGTVKVKQGKIFYEDFRKIETPIDKAPVSVLNILSIVLPLLTYLQDKCSNVLTIVEEPESYLHPYAQLLMALLLTFLSYHNMRLMITTSSGILIYLLYVLKTMKIYENDIMTMLEELCKTLQIPYKDDDNIHEIISTIVEYSRKVNLKVYLFNYDGTSKEVNIESLGENIPTITDVPSLLMDWIINILFRDSIRK